jgi:DNA-binding MarR family transcriptional regulator
VDDLAASSDSGGAAPDAAWPTAPAATIEDDLGWALGVLFRGYRQAAGAAVANLPGGPRGFQVLIAAAGQGCGNQLAVAHQLGIDRTVMTYLLDDLEQAGLVMRRADPADRRARLVTVTLAGQKRLAELVQALRAAEGQVLSALEPADRRDFRALLQRLATSVASSNADVAVCGEQPTGRLTGDC